MVAQNPRLPDRALRAGVHTDTELKTLQQRYFGADNLASVDDDMIEEGLARLLIDYARSDRQDLIKFALMQEALALPNRHKRLAEALARRRQFEAGFFNDPLAYGTSLEAAMAIGDTLAVRLLLAMHEQDRI